MAAKPCSEVELGLRSRRIDLGTKLFKAEITIKAPASFCLNPKDIESKYKDTEYKILSVVCEQVSTYKSDDCLEVIAEVKFYGIDPSDSANFKAGFLKITEKPFLVILSNAIESAKPKEGPPADVSLKIVYEANDPDEEEITIDPYDEKITIPFHITRVSESGIKPSDEEVCAELNRISDDLEKTQRALQTLRQQIFGHAAKPKIWN